MIVVPTEDSFNSRGLSAWIASLKQSILKKPDSAELHALLGVYYGRLNYFPEAISSLEKSINLNVGPHSNFAWSFINLGVVYNKIKNYPKGLDVVNKAIELNPKILSAYELLGMIKLDQGKPDEAISAVKNILKNYPDHIGAINVACRAYLMLNDEEKTLFYFREKLLISPDYTNYNDLGSAYAHFGKHEDAIVNYEKAVELNPRGGKTYLNLGSIYLKIKNYQKAIHHSQKAIEHDPDSLSAYINLGNAQLQLGQLDIAKATYNIILLKSPDVSGVHKNIGYIYAQNKNSIKAISHFQEYLRLSPNPPDVAQVQSTIQTLKNPN
jgi:tetratricopeptide (TPR) repeat protein